MAADTSACSDCSAFLSALAEEYERSCAFLSELERGLSAASTPAVAPEPEQPEGPRPPKATGTKTNIVRFFSRKASTTNLCQTTTSLSADPQGDHVRRPSVVNLGGEQLDQFLASESTMRRSTSLRPRRGSLALQPLSIVARQQGQAFPDLDDIHRAYASASGQPTTPRRTATDQLTRSLHSQDAPWLNGCIGSPSASSAGRAGLPKIFPSGPFDSQELPYETADDSPFSSAANADMGDSFCSPTLTYNQSALYAPTAPASPGGVGPSKAPLASRENSVRARSFAMTRRGSEHDSLLQGLAETPVGLSGGAATGGPRRPTPLMPLSATGSLLGSPVASPAGSVGMLPALARSQSRGPSASTATAVLRRRLTVTNGCWASPDDPTVSEDGSGSESDNDSDRGCAKYGGDGGDSSAEGCRAVTCSASRSGIRTSMIAGGGSLRSKTHEGHMMSRREVAFDLSCSLGCDLSDCGGGESRSSTSTGCAPLRTSLTDGAGVGRTPMAQRSATSTGLHRFASSGRSQALQGPAQGPHQQQSQHQVLTPQPPQGPQPLAYHYLALHSLGRRRSKSLHITNLTAMAAGLDGRGTSGDGLAQRTQLCEEAS